MTKPDFHPLEWDDFTDLPETDYDLIQNPYESEGRLGKWGFDYEAVVRHKKSGKHYMATILWQGEEIVDTYDWTEVRLQERTEIVKEWIPTDPDVRIKSAGLTRIR